MSGGEQFIGDDWLYATLSGDSTLAGLVGDRIYPAVAPPATAYPLVTFDLASAPVIQTADARVLWVRAKYLIKVWSTGTSFEAGRAIWERINALLHRASGTTAAGTVIAATRAEELRGTDEAPNEQLRWVGGMVDLMVQSN